MNNLNEWQIQKENGVFDKRNQVNNLTGKEWLFSTRSVKTKDYLYYFELEPILQHNYIDFMPIELISDLISTFSKPGSVIIDPFANFGSIGYATSKTDEQRSFFGYNYDNKIKSVFDKGFSNQGINFSTECLTGDIINSTRDKNCILFSEQIYSSLNVETRKKETDLFRETLNQSLKIIYSIDSNLNYVIIAIQNTKDLNNYYYNTKDIFEMLSNFDLILKSELIWKIHENNFKLIKNFLLSKNISETEINFLLNDKRILVFKRS